MKIRPMGADLFHADRQTDMTKPNTVVAFRNSANALKKEEKKFSHVFKYAKLVREDIPTDSSSSFETTLGPTLTDTGSIL
jgi:hypothetical protein